MASSIASYLYGSSDLFHSTSVSQLQTKKLALFWWAILCLLFSFIMLIILFSVWSVLLCQFFDSTILVDISIFDDFVYCLLYANPWAIDFFCHSLAQFIGLPQSVRMFPWLNKTHFLLIQVWIRSLTYLFTCNVFFPLNLVFSSKLRGNSYKWYLDL
jgi:hypothetical protein